MADPGTIQRVFAQLTYASLESSSGRGGWQTKEVRGQLTSQETGALEALVTTSLPTPPGVDPRFASPEEVARWPRRFAFHPFPILGVDAVLATNSVSAGPDSSGRAGNVFTHAAVARTGELSARPIQWWRSASWLTPYGVAGVQAATLRSDELFVDERLAAQVNEFLAAGSNWRPGLLAVILDAVRAAMVSSTTVALLCEDVDEAVGWFRAVSACMTVSTSARFGFSTLETLNSRSAWERRGLHLVALLAASVSPRELANCVVIQSSEDAQLGTPDGDPHKTARGDCVEASAWSGVVLEHFLASGDIGPLVAHLAEVRARVPGEESADPGWALVVWALLQGGSELEAAGRRLVAQVSPAGAERDPEIAQVVSTALLTTMGSSTKERWNALSKLRASDYMMRLATGAYAQSAFEETSWFRTQDEVVPATLQRPKLTDAARKAVLRFTDAPTASDTLDAVACMRACSLVNALGWGADGPVQGAIEQLIEFRILPWLLDEGHSAAVFARVGPLDLATMELLREHMLSGAETRMIPLTTLKALDMLNAAYLDHTLLDDRNSISALGSQISEALVTNAVATGTNPDVRAVYYAARAVLGRQHLRSRFELEAALLASPLPPHLMVELLAESHQATPSLWVAQTMLSSPLDDATLPRLCISVERGSPAELVPLAYAVRSLLDFSFFSGHLPAPAAQLAVGLLEAIGWIRKQVPSWRPTTDVAARTAILATSAVLSDYFTAKPLPPVEVLPPLAASEALAKLAAPLVLAAVGASTQWPDPLIRRLAYLSAPRDKRAPDFGQVWTFLQTYGSPGGDDDGWAELLVSEALRSIPAGDGVIDAAVGRLLDRWAAQGMRAERLKTTEKCLHAWFKARDIDDKPRARGLFRIGRDRPKEEN